VWSHNGGCEDIELSYVVSPGEHVDLRQLAALLRPEWIASDSLPPGRYYVWGEYTIGTKREMVRGARRWETTEDTIIRVPGGSFILDG